MSKTLVTEISIAAPAKVVWEALTDFAARGVEPVHRRSRRRGTGREQADAPDAAGGWPGDDAATQGIEAVAGEKLRWRGQLFGVPGLLDAEHSFLLEAPSAGVPGSCRARPSAVLSSRWSDVPSTVARCRPSV